MLGLLRDARYSKKESCPVMFQNFDRLVNSHERYGAIMVGTLSKCLK